MILCLYPRDAAARALLGEVLPALGEDAAARAALELSLTLDWRQDLRRRVRVQHFLASLESRPFPEIRADRPLSGHFTS